MTTTTDSKYFILSAFIAALKDLGEAADGINLDATEAEHCRQSKRVDEALADSARMRDASLVFDKLYDAFQVQRKGHARKWAAAKSRLALAAASSEERTIVKRLASGAYDVSDARRMYNGLPKRLVTLTFAQVQTMAVDLSVKGAFLAKDVEAEPVAETVAVAETKAEPVAETKAEPVAETKAVATRTRK